MAAPAIHTDRPTARLRDVANAFSAEAEARANELESKVLTLAKAKRDGVADTRTLIAIPSGFTDPALSIDRVHAHIILNVPQQQNLRIAIAPLAHDQIAQRTGIPKDYYWRMLASQPELLAENINTWFQKEADKRLLRMLAPVDDADLDLLTKTGTQLKLRGVMGATYRAIDNAEILAELLPVARAHGALLKEYSLDERRVHAQFVTQDRSIQEIRAAVAEKYGVAVSEVGSHVRVNGKDISWVDEVVRGGFYFRNSEVGFAAMEITSFLDVLKCLNGMIQPAQVVQRHAGKRQTANEGDLNWISSATQQLDNAAIISRARDAALAALEDRKVVQLGNTLLAAKAEPLQLNAPLFEWVEIASEKLGLNETQAAIYKEETLNATLVERRELARVGRGGDDLVTKFAIVQGLTATARRIEDMDRRTELEKTGWSWLEGDTKELLKVGSEPVKRGGRAPAAAAK